MDNSNSRTKYDSAEWSKNCDVCSFVQLTSLPKRKGWETTELFKSKCPNCLGFISFWQKDRVRDGASILLDVRAGLWVQHLLYSQHRHRASPCPISRSSDVGCSLYLRLFQVAFSRNRFWDGDLCAAESRFVSTPRKRKTKTLRE